MFWFESSTDVNLCSLICSLTRLQLLQFPCTVVLLYGQVIEGCCKRSQWSPSTSLVFLCTGDEKKQTALSFDFHWISVHYWLCLGINSHCVQGHEGTSWDCSFQPPPPLHPSCSGGLFVKLSEGHGAAEPGLTLNDRPSLMSELVIRIFDVFTSYFMIKVCEGTRLILFSGTIFSDAKKRSLHQKEQECPFTCWCVPGQHTRGEVTGRSCRLCICLMCYYSRFIIFAWVQVRHK